MHLSSSGNDDITFIKERRLTSKILTIVIRDFSKELKQQEKSHDLMLEEIYDLTVKNLVYILPFYQDIVLFQQEDSTDDVDIEF